MSYKWPIVKSRDTSCTPVTTGDVEQSPDGGKTWAKLPNAPNTIAAKGKQLTCSFRHRKFPDGDYHSGGPFYTARNAPRTPTRDVKVQTGVSKPKRVSGPAVQPLNFGNGYTLVPSVAESNNDAHLDKYGAEAISIVDPLNPNAQLGVALGEFIVDKRISLPLVQSWRRRTEVAKAAGSEFLAAQFGWLPLIDEIKNTLQSVKDGHAILENYRSQDGHEVHREFEFEPIEEDTLLSKGEQRCHFCNENVAGFNAPKVVQTLRTVKKTRRWFSGTFVHYPNKAYDGLLGKRLAQKGGEIDKLFGLTLTPDVLWELAPWSWAIDWFSNAGNVLSNFTSFELHGLVMKYGFIMEEISGRETLFMPGTGISGIAGPPPNIWNDYSIKRRKEANPFGFGVSWEGLSPTQLAITAALGITRWR